MPTRGNAPPQAPEDPADEPAPNGLRPALQLAHGYGPQDLVETLRLCLRIVEALGEILDEGELSRQVPATAG